MSYLIAIEKCRRQILADNETPRDLLISAALKHAVMAEVIPTMLYQCCKEFDRLMGMQIEWTKPIAMTEPQISIRTSSGDKRIVYMLDAEGAAK